jgi:hypothetical protein
MSPQSQFLSTESMTCSTVDASGAQYSPIAFETRSTITMSKRQPIKRSCQKPNCSNPNCPFPHNKPTVSEEGPRVRTGSGGLPNDGSNNPLPRPATASAATPAINQLFHPDGSVERRCLRCRQQFVIESSQKEWFKSMEFHLPRRCKECREIRQVCGN